MSKQQKKQNAIDALLESNTLKEAAEKAGISRKTLYNYMRTDGDFARAYKEARERLTLERLDAVESERQQAKEIIISIMNDTEQSSAIRLRAAQTILDAGQSIEKAADGIMHDNVSRDVFGFDL